MKRQKILPGKSAQQGVIIIEAMIAILLFSLGVLAIIGLQAAMIKNTGDSKSRAEAANIAQQCIGELWAAPTAVVCPNALNNAASILPNGNLQILSVPIPTLASSLVSGAAPPPGATVTITITWLLPGAAAGTPLNNFATVTTISGN